MSISRLSISEFVHVRNQEKALFTPGPGALLGENIVGLRPCFGRNDRDYEAVEDEVLERLKNIAGQNSIVRLQGSASLSLEIAILNFLQGDVAILAEGYYGERLYSLVMSAKKAGAPIGEVCKCSETELGNLDRPFEWLLSCVTETSTGRLFPVSLLRKYANQIEAKLLLDATASMGLESDHHLADVTAFSSCKGLFGFTGASFISFNDVDSNEVNSFYLDIQTHFKKLVTGPYHTICSLSEVLPRLDHMRKAVEVNKEIFLSQFSEYLIHPLDRQPMLCTSVSLKFCASPETVLYEPRSSISGSVVCHLGETHLGDMAKGLIISKLRCET